MRLNEFIDSLEPVEAQFITDLPFTRNAILLKEVIKLGELDAAAYFHYIVTNYDTLTDDDFYFNEEKIYGWHVETNKCTCGMSSVGYSLEKYPEVHSYYCDGLEKH